MRRLSSLGTLKKDHFSSLNFIEKSHNSGPQSPGATAGDTSPAKSETKLAEDIPIARKDKKDWKKAKEKGGANENSERNRERNKSVQERKIENADKKDRKQRQKKGGAEEDGTEKESPEKIA